MIGKTLEWMHFEKEEDEEEEAAAAEGEKRYNCSMFLAVVVSFVVTRHLNRFLVCVR